MADLISGENLTAAIKYLRGMNTDVLERLNNCAGDTRKRQEAIREYIISLGINPTDEYVAVLEFLCTHEAHPNVDEIFSALNPTMPALSRTRIYSILEILAKLEAIRVVQVENNEMYYDTDPSPHGHFVCSSCGDIVDMPLSKNVDCVAKLPIGALLNTVQLLCMGECKSCQQRKNLN